MAATMEDIRTTPGLAPVADPPADGRRRLRPPEWARQLCAHRRERRVVLLVVVLCVLNGFDLAFTLLARHCEFFHEFNPIARSMIGNPPALIAYKAVLIGIGCLIILRFRTHLLAEIGCWGVCAFYSIVTGAWWSFYAAA